LTSETIADDSGVNPKTVRRDAKYAEAVCRDATQAELGDGSDDALIRLSVGLNVSRRHLSKSQKAIAAARLVSGTHGGDRSKLSNDNLKIK